MTTTVKTLACCICLLGFLSACNNKEGDSAQKDTSILPVSKQLPEEHNNLSPSSGKYGDISLAIDDSLVTGAYAYYDQQDRETREFLQSNVFYFYGIRSGNLCNTKAIEPGSRKVISGSLIPPENERQSLSLKLSENTDGYGAVDFTTGKGFESRVQEKTKWIQVRVVKTAKAKLFTAPIESSVAEAYLVAGDIVKVLDIQDSWMEVSYQSPGSSKSIIRWTKAAALHEVQPDKW